MTRAAFSGETAFAVGASGPEANGGEGPHPAQALLRPRSIIAIISAEALFLNAATPNPELDYR